MQMPKTTGLAWEIHPFNLFRLYRSPEGDGNDHNDHLKALFLLQASESGRAEDNFRFSFKGDVNIKVDFWGEDLLAARKFKPFSLSLETRLEDIELRRNSVSSSWMDLHQAISEGTVQVHKKDTNIGAKEEFLSLWEAEKASNPNFGAAIRWAILGCEDGLKLDLQGMPGMASTLKKDPRLSCDSCPAVTLSTLELAVNMELDLPLNGPIPILFSRNEAKTAANLKKNPEAISPGEKFVSNIIKI